MRFDLITIFPEYFAPLSLSLLGKAQQDGALRVHVHNLRDFASGKHLSVDDTPSGGGAGMVMRPDVWGKAIDASLEKTTMDEDGSQDSFRVVLAIPTPGGVPLNQRLLEDLTSADQIIVACGRYEGIDARVAEYYASAPDSVEVLEFSLGDYVLNGGEVAALALVEGVSRLVDGVVGNPDSLVEESHSADGLLEYPVYTRPRQWRDREIPGVLFGGDHGRIARWRRDRALAKTAQRRPDMIEKLLEQPGSLDRRDREVLAREGILLQPRRASVRFRVLESSEVDIQRVSELAGRTFPLACPPGTPGEEIEDFIQSSLSPRAIASMVADGARICVAEVGDQMVAYTLTLPRVDLDEVGGTRIPEHSSYLSKCYADPNWHGSGVSGAILEFAIEDAVVAWNPEAMVLGTNRGNQRAAKFYRHHGFVKAGKRTFVVGGRAHLDDVFVLDLTSV
ncbi:tRNA (guanosine(37)-N1)-methyltransferase TrmD [Actinomycetaceae bacterium MB13-C1-2]|nr:tRNA (guanosine(37)-N1)-methyltransferase TrmD [Actinomycetaceae bacterium MB13-C1-2]